MKAAYRKRIAESKASADSECASLARQHVAAGGSRKDIAAFQVLVRQRLNMAITDDYAANLLREA